MKVKNLLDIRRRAQKNFMLVINAPKNVFLKECFDIFFLLLCSILHMSRKFRFTSVIKSDDFKARKIAYDLY